MFVFFRHVSYGYRSSALVKGTKKPIFPLFYLSANNITYQKKESKIQRASYRKQNIQLYLYCVRNGFERATVFQVEHLMHNCQSIQRSSFIHFNGFILCSLFSCSSSKLNTIEWFVVDSSLFVASICHTILPAIWAIELSLLFLNGFAITQFRFRLKANWLSSIQFRRKIDVNYVKALSNPPWG